jgi:transcriptional regulator with XRE-family HTH domain
MTIGKRLKELRKKAGLTQAQVGALFTPAIERASVAQWEGDKTRPDQDRLETLARAYHTSIDYI